MRVPGKTTTNPTRRPSIAAKPKRSPRGTPVAAREKGAVAREQDLQAVNVFISYRHEDRIIATALRDALIEINRTRVDCFLDVESIRSGEDWEKRLDGALERADWLIALYTGEQSEFCGYEVGMFSRAKTAGTASDFRIVCLHDVDDPPGLFRPKQQKFVAPPPPTLPVAEPKSGPTTLSEEEVAFYGQSGVLEFLRDFCAYRGLWVVSSDGQNAERELSRQRDALMAATRRITLAFLASHASEIRSQTPTQLTLEIAFIRDGKVPVTVIPDDALVTGTFASFALFGLMPAMRNRQLPSCSWDEVRTACRTRSASNSMWMFSLEREMVNVINGRLLGAPEATFMAAAGNQVYRPILVSHTVRNNGNNEFQIVFVETLPRQFLGYQKTSLLLAGLIQASRFRFAYLEEPERVAGLFSDIQADADFVINCRQLRYDIERLQSESVEFGLLDPVAFVAAFGPSRKALAESFGTAWEQAKTSLMNDLPNLDQPIKPEERSRAKAAITRFIDAMSGENKRFVIAALDAYREAIVNQR